MKLLKIIMTIASTSLLVPVVHAQPYNPPYVDHYNAGQQAPYQNNPAQNQPPTPPLPQANYNSNGLPPGTYTVQNPNGGTSTIYTTGDKQPYMVSPPSNGTDTPIIQPYVNYGPNGPVDGNPGMRPNPNNPGFRGNMR